MKKILITGAAGFIGFHLAKSLLKDGETVFGLDSLNDYYDVNLKLARLELLNQYDNFSFEKINICNYNDVEEIFNLFSPQIVVNLGAQAGIRHSINAPFSYIESNIVGFMNIIEQCRHNKIESFIYASSSSVYGSNSVIPFDESQIINSPISLYAATKASNELIAHAYSNLYDLHSTGLRYFTVYGPWGRPDMAVYKFTEKIKNDIEIEVYNNGMMKRDFTYIDDIISGTKMAINKNYKCETFNLGNNTTVNLMDLVRIIEKELDKKAKISFLPLQSGDIIESYADINKSKEMLDFFPSTKIEEGIKSFVDWYKKYSLSENGVNI